MEKERGGDEDGAGRRGQKAQQIHVGMNFLCPPSPNYRCTTGFSSEIGTKLRDWAVGQAWGSCYSWAALSSNDSKRLYESAKVEELYEQK